ncbi:MAG: hypothetical protein P4L67_05065 [Candidatus Pacebacteria bacterium]|nr:hypothetical protein [Candidatus Paceibacterota bacterium]
MALTEDIRNGLWRNSRHVVQFYPDGTLKSGREILMAVDRAAVPCTVYFETSYQDDVDDGFGFAVPGGDCAILDETGEFMMLDKSSLFIDVSYQRETAIHFAKSIKRKFRWSSFGTLLVARRPDGSFFVYDGGHRLLAANMIDAIEFVPCMVYEMQDKREESNAYIATNEERRRITPHDDFKAKCEAGVANAVFLRDLFAQDGYVVQPGGTRSVRCIKMMMNLASQDREILRQLWPLFVELHDGEFINESVVAPLFYIQKNSEGESLLRTKWHSKLVDLKASGIIKAAREAREYHRNKGVKTSARGVLDELNHGQRKEYSFKIK